MVPNELRGRAQWLIWRFEPNEKNPEGKPLKVPYYVSGARRVGGQGEPRDRARLSGFDAAVAASSRLGYDGIGFAFLPDDGLIGIDLDDMIDPETGEVSERCLAIIKECDSYTEYSPSKKGVHIFVLGSTETFKSNKIGVEVFCNAQYFTFTGEHYPGTPQTVNALDDKVLRRLRATVDEAKGKRKATSLAAPGVAPIAGTGAKTARLENDFHKVNDAAIHNLDAWVPTLFPNAKRSTKGYRVTSSDLGRDLQEDLSITSDGIVDFGVADTGDAREGRRTPIDLAIEWGKAGSAKEALHWLAGQLGITLAKPPGGAGSRKKPRGSQNDGGGEQGGNSGPSDDGMRPPDDEDEDPFPVIRWQQGLLPQCVNEAEKALMESNERIYQRSGFLVRVVKRDTPSVRNYNRQPGSLGIHVVDTPYLVEAFTRSAHWKKYDARADKWRATNAPEQAAATYLARVGQWKVPRLWSVISAPTLRPDGTLLQTPGYDAATQTWYDPGDVVFPEVPDQPTVEDAKLALEQIRDAFGTFPWANKVDEAVAISLALTSLVRRSLPSAPLGAISAPVMASGKTLLADCISILSTGVPAPAMKYAETDEEAAKTALAVLAEGDAVVLIDNVERPLQGDWLCSILTSETYRQRVLGRTQMMSVPTTTLFLATGNQLVIAGDLRTRALLCRLDPKAEHPELREFKYDIRERMTINRASLVAAGLTLMRAYIVAGGAGGTDKPVKAWGRFEQWSDMVRAPLVWQGMVDPCGSISALEADDPERNSLVRMLHAWQTVFFSEAMTAGEVIAEIDRPADQLGIDKKTLLDILREVALDRNKQLSPRRLGHWLRQHADRRVAGMQFTKGGEKDHTALWRIEKHEEVKTG